MKNKKFIYKLHINDSSAEDTNEEHITANDDDGTQLCLHYPKNS